MEDGEEGGNQEEDQKSQERRSTAAEENRAGPAAVEVSPLARQDIASFSRSHFPLLSVGVSECVSMCVHVCVLTSVTDRSTRIRLALAIAIAKMPRHKSL